MIRYRCQFRTAAVLTACNVVVHTVLFFITVKPQLDWDRALNVLVAWTSPMAGILVAFLVFLEIPASVRGFRPGWLSIGCHSVIVLAITYAMEVLSDDTVLMVTPLGLEPRLDYVYLQPRFMFLWWMGSIVMAGIVQLWLSRPRR